jgi:hypothetical protein
MARFKKGDKGFWLGKKRSLEDRIKMCKSCNSRKGSKLLANYGK